MSQSENNLIWVDLEMTGLDINNDYIIEVASIVTDAQLNILAEGPIVAVYQPDEKCFESAHYPPAVDFSSALHEP